jgi:hypothetical protein
MNTLYLSMRRIHVRHNQDNKGEAEEMPYMIFANVDGNGVVVPIEKGTRLDDIERRFYPKVGIDFKTGNKIPELRLKDFVTHQKQYGKRKLGRILFSDMMNLAVDDEGNVTGRAVDVRIKKDTFRKWDTMFGMNKIDGKPAPLVLIGAKPGGNGTLFFTQVTKQDVKDAQNWDAYWEAELSYMSESDRQRIKKDIDAMASAMWKQSKKQNRFVTAQIIAKHKYVKDVKYPTYLEKHSVIDIFKRFSLDFAQGLVATGSGDASIYLFETDNLRVKHNDKDIPVHRRADGQYLLDGMIPVSQEYLFRTGESLGYDNSIREMTEQKTAMRHREDHGGLDVDYLSVKGMEFTLQSGLEIYDGKTLIARTEVQEIRGVKMVNIVDTQGNQIDKLISTNEAKNRAGKYNVAGFYTLPEYATRTYFIQPKDSKRHSSFLNAWIHLLNNVGFDKLHKILVDEFNGTLHSHVDALEDIRTPDGMARFIQSLYNEEGNVSRELNDRINPGGEGFIDGGYHHNDILDMVYQRIYNRVVKDGLVKGRRYGASSFGRLRADLSGTIQNPDEMMIGNNTVTIEAIKVAMNNNKATIDQINTWLQKNEYYAVPYRQPVNSLFDVIPKRVVKVDLELGDTLALHPETVFDVIQGDYDGDIVYLQLFKHKGPEMQEFLRLSDETTAEGKKLKDYNMSVSLAVFKKLNRGRHYLNGLDYYNTMYHAVLGREAPGFVRTAMLSRNVMELMDLRVKINGIEIRIKGENDDVLMDYAPLNDEVELGDLPKGVSIIGAKNKDGETIKVMKTKVHHELAILMNAATDIKDMLLGQWGYNGPEFMTDRIYERVDGKPLDFELRTALSRLTLIMNPRSVYKKSKGFEDFYEQSREIYDMIGDTKEGTEERKEAVVDYYTGKLTEALDRLKESEEFSKKFVVEFEPGDLEINGKLDPLFESMKLPYQRHFEYNKKVAEQGGVRAEGNPLGYNPNRIANAHHIAVDRLMTTENLNKLGIDPKMLEPGTKEYLLTQQMRREFWSMLQHGEVTEYSRGRLRFKERWGKILASKSEDQRKAITVLFLQGNRDRQRPLTSELASELLALYTVEAELTAEKSTVKKGDQAKIQKQIDKANERIDYINANYRKTDKAILHDMHVLLPASLMDASVYRVYANYHDVQSATGDKPSQVRKDHSVDGIYHKKLQCKSE